MKTPQPQVDELVIVRWHDATFDRDEADLLDRGERDYMVDTVGWVRPSRSNVVRIAAERLPDGWRAITTIPVKLIEELKVVA